jgi:L-fuculose-phosphate aldolase
MPASQQREAEPLPDQNTIARLIEVCRLIYDRGLSDSAGGNVSIRARDLIYATPRYMGSKYRWSIQPEHISVLDSSYEVLSGPEVLTRESRCHFAIYDAFPNIRSVIHAHPRYVNVFAAACRPIPPVLEYTRKFGPITPIEPTLAQSQELATRVVAMLQDQDDDFSGHGAGVLLPYHGIVVIGRSLDDAYDNLERIESAARCALLGALLEDPE